MPVKKSKSMDKMPARRVPEGFEFPKTTKKPMPKLEGAKPGVKKPMPKTQGAKPGVKKPMAKTLTGPAAIAELQRQISPRGVKKAEANAKKAIDKKYPGLYKSSKVVNK
jgi:hypothetical protein